MLKALVLAASALGLAAVGLAQDDPEQYWSIDDQPGPWFLQRSTCTLAHNVNGESIAVVRLRASMGVEIEFLDPDLRGVRVDETAPFVVSVDGAREESFGMGIAEEDRQGYRLSVSDGMLERIRTGRRLEAGTGERTLLRLDLAGAERALAAMEDCILEAAAHALANGNEMDPFANATDEDWGNGFDPYGNGAVPEDWNGFAPHGNEAAPEGMDGMGSIPNAM